MRCVTVVAPPTVAMGVAGRAKFAVGWVPGIVGWFGVPPEPLVAGANVAKVYTPTCDGVPWSSVTRLMEAWRIWTNCGELIELERSKSSAMLMPQLAGSAGLGAGVTVMAAEAGGDHTSVTRPQASRTTLAKSAIASRSRVRTVFSPPRRRHVQCRTAPGLVTHPRLKAP